MKYIAWFQHTLSHQDIFINVLRDFSLVRSWWKNISFTMKTEFCERRNFISTVSICSFSNSVPKLRFSEFLNLFLVFFSLLKIFPTGKCSLILRIPHSQSAKFNYILYREIFSHSPFFLILKTMFNLFLVCISQH